MADSFLHRGAARRHRTRDATHSARNRSFRSSAEINKANIITPHAAEISTRGSAGRRTDRRRHRGILHIHDLYAEVSQAFSRPQRRSDHIGDRQLARFWDDPSADLWRISDRVGRKWLLIGFGVTGVLFTIPLLTTLQTV